jgi:hypothetical protein
LTQLDYGNILLSKIRFAYSMFKFWFYNKYNPSWIITMIFVYTMLCFSTLFTKAWFVQFYHSFLVWLHLCYWLTVIFVWLYIVIFRTRVRLYFYNVKVTDKYSLFKETNNSVKWQYLDSLNVSLKASELQNSCVYLP